MPKKQYLFHEPKMSHNLYLQKIDTLWQKSQLKDWTYQPMWISRKYRKPFTGMLKYLANNNPKDSLNIQFGIMQLSYSLVHQRHYLEDYYISHKTRSRKYLKL